MGEPVPPVVAERTRSTASAIAASVDRSPTRSKCRIQNTGIAATTTRAIAATAVSVLFTRMWVRSVSRPWRKTLLLAEREQLLERHEHDEEEGDADHRRAAEHDGEDDGGGEGEDGDRPAGHGISRLPRCEPAAPPL